MSKSPDRPHATTTKEEVLPTSIPQSSAKPETRNAFTAMMSPHKRPPKRRRSPPPSVPASDPSRNTTFLGRDGLGAYIQAPESFPPSRVIYHNDKFVLIHDLYPKSSIHLLLLPRDPTKTLVHPFDAFEDADFLNDVKAEVSRAKTLAAKELKRRFGKSSRKDQAQELAAEETAEDHDAHGPGADDSQENQEAQGRDWEAELVAGIHAVPSMNHLHVHIISRDRHSESLRHRKHYNSFSTDFFVPIGDFPLDPADKRRHPGREGFLNKDFKCWRCGKDFGNRFARLKEHLEEEFEEWKRE